MMDYSKKISYLACPYSHQDPAIRIMRHQLVNKVAFEFHKRGKLVYSPLTDNIPLIHLGDKENSWEDWSVFDKEMLSRCDELIVLKIQGWEISKGVSGEIAFAEQLHLPIEIIDPMAYFNLNIDEFC